MPHGYGRERKRRCRTCRNLGYHVLLMRELITLDRRPLHARLASRPVGVSEYRAYLHATGQPVPSALARQPRGTDPVTYVSQIDARAYCQWLGAQEGQAYRLPSVPELLALLGEAGTAGSAEDFWPHTHGEAPGLEPSEGANYLCEWTRETEAVQQPPGSRAPERVLGSVFYPPWLRPGNNPTQVQAMLLASQGYSFVSFRLAADL